MFVLGGSAGLIGGMLGSSSNKPSRFPLAFLFTQQVSCVCNLSFFS